MPNTMEIIKKMNRNRNQKDLIKALKDIKNYMENREESIEWCLMEIEWYLAGVNDRLDTVISELVKSGGEQDETAEETR